ncbi:MAG: DUF1993 domain-containing protein [Sphingomonadales bacterium]|nr:DUF1993 domain-containing protein [Sphingomonadales bacterium]
MPFSLYDAVVPTWRQILPAVLGVIDKAEAHCRDLGTAPSELIEARLAPDMWDFATQVRTVAAHSGGALDGVRAGVFAPSFDPPPADFAGLRALLQAALAKVEAAGRDELDSRVGAETLFRFPGHEMRFTTEDFLTSFSLPNFYFHASAAYAILRMKGVPIGKLDFLGQIRARPA